MKKPLLLFAIKFSVIMYFAACTSVENYTSARSATPIVTKGAWKVNLYRDANKDQTNDFAGYTFTFNASGIVKASRNGVDINGNWAEDNISNRITINLGAKDPSLTKLNTNWNIREITNRRVDLQDNANTTTDELNITML